MSSDADENGKKSHTCKYCDKSYAWKIDLTRHMKLHTGETPHVCQLCDKVFARKNHLDIHMVTHTGEKKFACASCDKVFALKSNLTRHMRTHTGYKPYPCIICNKSFIQKGDLEKHVRSHTGERPFKCEECGKSFIDKSNLSVHRKTHTGLKPYTCELCNRAFGRKDGLNVHMKSVHEMKKARNDTSSRVKLKSSSGAETPSNFSENENLIPNLFVDCGETVVIKQEVKEEENESDAVDCRETEEQFSVKQEMDDVAWIGEDCDPTAFCEVTMNHAVTVETIDDRESRENGRQHSDSVV